MTTPRKIKIGVLIGGGGRLPAIYHGLEHEDSPAEIAIVVSFKRESAGLEWAKEQGLKATYFRWADFKKEGRSRQEFDTALNQLLKEYQIELIVLAGWGLLLTPEFFKDWQNRIINVHPALLTPTFEKKVRLENGHYIPVFRGNDAIPNALHSGINRTGCTVHYVTTLMDTGPIVTKKEVPIYHNDTIESLTKRIHKAEDEILPIAITQISNELLTRNN